MGWNYLSIPILQRCNRTVQPLKFWEWISNGYVNLSYTLLVIWLVIHAGYSMLVQEAPVIAHGGNVYWERMSSFYRNITGDDIAVSNSSSKPGVKIYHVYGTTKWHIFDEQSWTLVGHDTLNYLGHEYITSHASAIFVQRSGTLKLPHLGQLGDAYVSLPNVFRVSSKALRSIATNVLLYIYICVYIHWNKKSGADCAWYGYAL